MKSTERANSKLSIRSRQGILMWLGAFSAVLFGGGILTAVILSLMNMTKGKITLMQALTGIIGSLVCLFMACAIIKTGARVSNKSIKTWMLSAKREIIWTDVESITIPAGGSGVPFVGWNIAVVPKKKEGMPRKIAIVPTAFFGNGHLLGKAIIEAAWRANPSVIIDDTLIMTFGKPPYGVFNKMFGDNPD